MEKFIMASPNCLCKLKHFTIYLRDLILERSEWNIKESEKWPLLHDLIAITLLACLKNEDFKLLRKNVFGWVKYDNEVYLREFRSKDNDRIVMYSRLNGFTKYVILLTISCTNGYVQIRGQVHPNNDEELEYYEMKAVETIASKIHFALCGGYYEGKPVYLQYNVAGLLNSINRVIEKIRGYITQNWQYNSIMEYLKHIPIFIFDSMFSKDDDDYLETEMNEINDGKFSINHTNPENLMFLSPEMCAAQVKTGLILYHYRDNEKLIGKNNDVTTSFPKNQPSDLNNTSTEFNGFGLNNWYNKENFETNYLDINLSHDEQLERLAEKSEGISNIVNPNLKKSQNIFYTCEEFINVQEESLIQEVKGCVVIK